jgi:hypothetical protein
MVMLPQMVSYFFGQQARENSIPGGGHDDRLNPQPAGDFPADGGIKADDFVFLIDKVKRRIGAAHGDFHLSGIFDLGQFIGPGHGCETQNTCQKQA